MRRPAVTFNTRKSLCNQLGEQAGNEIADLLQSMAQRVESLERTKVDVTPIVPGLLIDDTPADFAPRSS